MELGSGMRWQQLFTDLQAEFDEAAAREERTELPSRSRAETSTVRLAERIGGAVGGAGASAVRRAERVGGAGGGRVALRCRGAGEVAGRLTDAGVDWALLVDDTGREGLGALPRGGGGRGA